MSGRFSYTASTNSSPPADRATKPKYTTSLIPGERFPKSRGQYKSGIIFPPLRRKTVKSCGKKGIENSTLYPS